MRKSNNLPSVYYLLLLLSLAVYILLGYFTPRTNFYQLISLFGLSFGLYYYLYQLSNEESNIRVAIYFSIIARFALLFVIPNLSDDYFRFIWDGRLWSHGINPFSVLPSSIVDTPQPVMAGIDRQLYDSMNSPGYFTIYPPVLQYIFRLSAFLFPSSVLGSVVVMRLFILAAEVGSILLITELLKRYRLSAKNLLLYALNPLVIIELTGNLHFEALMIFFLLLAVYLLTNQQLTVSAVAFAMSVCSKLLPLMFLPLLLKRVGVKKSAWYYAICGAVSLLLFVPFIDRQFLENISTSINLYFAKFEFNASIFYLVRWVGFQTAGYDIIRQAGTILSGIALLLILFIAFFQKTKEAVSIFTVMLFCLTTYFAFATIVHPWYITTLVAFSVFTTWRFPIVWSGLILLSYFTYRTSAYSESLLLVVIEYGVVFGVLIYEWKGNFYFRNGILASGKSQ